MQQNADASASRQLIGSDFGVPNWVPDSGIQTEMQLLDSGGWRLPVLRQRFFRLFVRKNRIFQGPGRTFAETLFR